jgi:3-deoxy-D-manno-octulosonate 8-phosphate phosphatase KdsC-like HAD superfamily phosphatase
MIQPPTLLLTTSLKTFTFRNGIGIALITQYGTTQTIIAARTAGIIYQTI